ncbi:lipid-binding protein [Wenyingzhuangia sp. IMCC45467]
MKKNIIYISLLIIAFTMNSCNEEVEVWDSETLDYSGTFFWELYDEDMTTKYVGYDHDVQLWIYNTAENIPNKVWIEDTDHVFPLKSKFSFTGTSESFMSDETEFDNLDNDIIAIETPTVKPTGLNEETTEDRYYIRNLIVDGKILPMAGTTVSGNPVDSIYIKIKLLSGTVKFTSYEIPEALRADPEQEEYDWKYDSATYDNTLDEIYVISGHRKTGFAEDDH